MADEEIEENAEENESKGNKNKIMMIAILVIGLGFGGGGAYFLLNNAGNPEGDDETAEEVVEEEEVAIMEHKFVLFEAMAVPVHDSRGKYIGNYKITIKVLTENDNKNVKVRNLKFELRHAFISRIAKGGFLLPNSTNLDYDKTANILKDIAKNLVGGDAVIGVTIENVMRVNN